MGCHYFVAIKANKAWQEDVLNPKFVYMVKTILLAIAIFYDPNFLLCTRYTLNFAKKLELKTKNLRVDIIKERIRQIWAYKMIAKLDPLFTNNLD